MDKRKYEIKEVFEEGCTETYIFKGKEKLTRIPKDDWGNVCSPMEIIELLVEELNSNQLKGEKMNKKNEIKEWKDNYICGAKRSHIKYCEGMYDWFVGYGKDESCQFEGTWWDMICFARNILASENTKMASPEFYKPEWKNNNYCGEKIPYKFKNDNITE